MVIGNTHFDKLYTNTLYFSGKCEPCAEDFFKPEASAEPNCRRKSR